MTRRFTEAKAAAVTHNYVLVDCTLIVESSIPASCLASSHERQQSDGRCTGTNDSLTGCIDIHVWHRGHVGALLPHMSRALPNGESTVHTRLPEPAAAQVQVSAHWYTSFPYSFLTNKPLSRLIRPDGLQSEPWQNLMGSTSCPGAPKLCRDLFRFWRGCISRFQPCQPGLMSRRVQVMPPSWRPRIQRMGGRSSFYSRRPTA